MEINSGASLTLQDSPQSQAEAGSLPEIESLLGLFPGPSCSPDSLLGALPQETLGSLPSPQGLLQRDRLTPTAYPEHRAALLICGLHIWLLHGSSREGTFPSG